jgi:uncharacterized LabA/DUF88 family protein
MSDAEDEVVTLLFHQQADGRKVSRLPGGKVVLVDLNEITRVADGEWWLVRLRHKETFAIATPIEKVKEPQPRPGADAVIPATAPPLAATPVAMQGVAPPVTAPAPARPVRAITAPPTVARERSHSTAFQVGGMLIEPENILRPGDRIALFVDGANMDHAARAAGYFVDYKKARDYFVGPANFYAAFYYVADVTASDPVQLRFLDFLSYAGFIIRRKPVKVIIDQDTGEQTFKGNLDTEIVLDMLNTVNNYDVAFLFSGDSDFERAVDLLRSRGKRVYVVTSRKSLARELAYVADKPVFCLEDFQSVLARTDERHEAA